MSSSSATTQKTTKNLFTTSGINTTKSGRACNSITYIFCWGFWYWINPFFRTICHKRKRLRPLHLVFKLYQIEYCVVTCWKSYKWRICYINNRYDKIVRDSVLWQYKGMLQLTFMRDMAFQSSLAFFVQMHYAEVYYVCMLLYVVLKSLSKKAYVYIQMEQIIVYVREYLKGNSVVNGKCIYSKLEI